MTPDLVRDLSGRATQPTLRESLRAAHRWNTAARAAAPGTVWTSRYTSRFALTGGPCASFVAGSVVLDQECPRRRVHRARTVLGELRLTRRRRQWVSGPEFAQQLLPGDVAPVLPAGTGADLAGVDTHSFVMVEHYRPDWSQGGPRSVDVGFVDDSSDPDDPWTGVGRYVGDTFVRLDQVTGFALIPNAWKELL